MIDQNELERLNSLSQQLEEIYKPIHIDEYNAPINRSEERTRFEQNFSLGEPYNPQFKYRQVPEGLGDSLRQFICEIRPDRTSWEYLLYKDAKRMLDTLETVSTHDPAQITSVSIAFDGLPTKELVKDAYEALSAAEGIAHEVETLAAVDAAQIMREALDSVHLDDWEIIIDDVMNANMMVRSVDRKIKIRKEKKFSLHAIKRLLVHEIGTHVFRYTNGASQNLHLLRLGLSGYMMTEEGMATYHEEKHGLRDLVTSRRYALRVIAAHLSLTQSFFDVFTQIIKFTDFNDAFEIVARSKRGFADTAQYGSHIKDKVYFEGFKRVSVHLNDRPQDYPLLMSGKVSVDMLSPLADLRESGLFVEPHYLPELIKLPN